LASSSGSDGLPPGAFAPLPFPRPPQFPMNRPQSAVSTLSSGFDDLALAPQTMGSSCEASTASSASSLYSESDDESDEWSSRMKAVARLAWPEPRHVVLNSLFPISRNPFHRKTKRQSAAKLKYKSSWKWATLKS
jgi:hypothetical protein